MGSKTALIYVKMVVVVLLMVPRMVVETLVGP